MAVMLILRGIADSAHPKGLLDDESALATAAALGFTGEVLDMAGRAFAHSPQVKAALARMQQGGDVEALYGFSAGGYNVAHIWEDLNDAQRAKIKMVIVLGSPGITKTRFNGCEHVTIRLDPSDGHMAGPRAFLGELTKTA